MDPHVLFKLGTHSCDSSDKRSPTALRLRVSQKQTVFMWVRFLVAMTTELPPPKHLAHDLIERSAYVYIYSYIRP